MAWRPGIAALLVTWGGVGVARAEEAHRPAWFGAPDPDAATGVHVAVGAGRVNFEHLRPDGDYDRSPKHVVVMMLQVGVRVAPTLRLEGAVAGGLPAYSPWAFSAPTLALTWSPAVGPLRLALRGIGSVGIPRPDGPEAASALLVHDPLIGAAAANTGTLQATAHAGSHGLRARVGAAVTVTSPETGAARTLVRADAGLGGALGATWTWSAEAGVSSDRLDADRLPGQALVPLWSAGLRRHADGASYGLVATSPVVDTTAQSLVGPTLLLDLRGDL